MIKLILYNHAFFYRCPKTGVHRIGKCRKYVHQHNQHHLVHVGDTDAHSLHELFYFRGQ